jgi:secondary thiamine-phosphate synthase enzyme
MEGHVLLTPLPEVARLTPRRRARTGGVVSSDRLLRIRSRRPVDLIDLTEELTAFTRRSGVGVGFVGIQVLHTTAALFLNENEPLLHGDLVELLERLAPCARVYQHDDFSRRAELEPDERVNGHSHAKALLLRASETLHVVGGAPRLGRFQRVFLAELDGPRERDVSLLAFGAR